jgi:rubredoxin
MSFVARLLPEMLLQLTYPGGIIMPDFKKYQCRECEHIYDEAKGDPDSGLVPGTRRADIPNDWSCPICGAPKDFFKLIE